MSLACRAEEFIHERYPANGVNLQNDIVNGTLCCDQLAIVEGCFRPEARENSI